MLLPQYFCSSSVQLRVLELVSSNNGPVNWSSEYHYLTVNPTVSQDRNSASHLEYILFPDVETTTVLCDVTLNILVDVYHRVQVAY